MKLHIFLALLVATLAFAEDDGQYHGPGPYDDGQYHENEEYEIPIKAEQPELRTPSSEVEWRARYGRYPVDSILALRYEDPEYYRDPIKEYRYRYEYPRLYRYRASYDPEYYYNRYGYYPSDKK